MKNTTLAYIAGGIDADGYVTIHCSNRRDVRFPVYSALVGFTNTSPVVPKMILGVLGGRINEYQPPNPKHKRWYMWTADGHVAFAALIAIRRFLVLKKKQAEIVIKFFNECQRQKRKLQKHNGRLTPAIVAVRRRLWRQVRHLNQPRNVRVHF